MAHATGNYLTLLEQATPDDNGGNVDDSDSNDNSDSDRNDETCSIHASCNYTMLVNTWSNLQCLRDYWWGAYSDDVLLNPEVNIGAFVIWGSTKGLFAISVKVTHKAIHRYHVQMANGYYVATWGSAYREIIGDRSTGKLLKFDGSAFGPELLIQVMLNETENGHLLHSSVECDFSVYRVTSMVEDLKNVMSSDVLWPRTYLGALWHAELPNGKPIDPLLRQYGKNGIALFQTNTNTVNSMVAVYKQGGKLVFIHLGSSGLVMSHKKKQSFNNMSEVLAYLRNEFVIVPKTDAVKALYRKTQDE